MRVIAGIYKGRKLKYPKTKVTRPTSDMVKLAVFNMLNIKGGFVLDLFAGSGSYGIEAISRGAEFCYFIDNNNEAIKTILDNITNLNILNYKIEKISWDTFLKTNTYKFQYIFLDPPFNFNNYNQLLDTLNAHIAVNANIILEVHKTTNIDKLTNYKLLKEKIYGNKKIIILQNNNNL